MDRAFWVWLHRWAGLYMASFLTVAGLTGSVIAFQRELDEWLNPDRYAVVPSGPLLSPVELLQKARHHAAPTVRLDAMALDIAPGRPVGVWPTPRIDPATGRPYPHTQREIILDPHTGALLRERLEDTPAPIWPVTRRNAIDAIYRLHYSLALPGSIGTWLFGVAAVIWTLDCFVGAYLTFPLRRKSAPRGHGRSWLARWRPAWAVRAGRGSHVVCFDLHRAGGLWVWGMLLVFAWSSVGLNLGEAVYRPVMDVFFDMRELLDEQPLLEHPLETPALDWHQALAAGRRLAADQAFRQGFVPHDELALVLDRPHGLYAYRFHSDRDIGRYGESSVLFDADTGALRAVSLQSEKRRGPWLSDWLFALHFGAVGGWPYRIFVAAMGLSVAMLSVTGVWIWNRKRLARRARR